MMSNDVLCYVKESERCFALYAKYSHAVSGHMPRHDKVAESTPKADEEGGYRMCTAPPDSRYRGCVA